MSDLWITRSGRLHRAHCQFGERNETSSPISSAAVAYLRTAANEAACCRSEIAVTPFLARVLEHREQRRKAEHAAYRRHVLESIEAARKRRASRKAIAVSDFVDPDSGEVLTRTQARHRIGEVFLAHWVACEEEWGYTAQLPDDCEQQLRRWVFGYSAPIEQILDAVTVTFEREPTDPYRYMCGVVWSKIRTAAAIGWGNS